MLPTDEYYINAKARDTDGKLVSYGLNYASNNTAVVSVDNSGI